MREDRIAFFSREHHRDMGSSLRPDAPRLTLRMALAPPREGPILRADAIASVPRRSIPRWRRGSISAVRSHGWEELVIECNRMGSLLLSTLPGMGFPFVAFLTEVGLWK